MPFLFFAALWSFVLAWGWGWFYRYIFPPWMRYSGLAWGMGYGMLGFGMWWLSIRLAGRLRLSSRPAVYFCLLGGLEGLLSHLWAIFGLGAVSKPPILHGVDPLAALTFAVFEKIFYWILILLLAVGISRVSERFRRQPQPV